MKAIQIAAYKNKANGNIFVGSGEFSSQFWERVSEFEDWEPDPIVERPYYMKNEYELINTPKEFGLKDLYNAWNAGHVDYFNKPRTLSVFENFVAVAKKRGWINE
jgi:hypothetical protein